MADMTKDQAQDHPPSWAALMGEDLGPSIFEGRDEGALPPPMSSAMIMAKRRRSQDAKQRQEQDLAQLQVLAKEEEEDAALSHAIHLISKGGYPGRETTRMAMAAQARRGTNILSSAQILAARARRP